MFIPWFPFRTTFHLFFRFSLLPKLALNPLLVSISRYSGIKASKAKLSHPVPCAVPFC